MPPREGPRQGLRKRVRSVQTLTEEQIQQKRIVDRRAQRAARQRTRDAMAELEQRHTRLQEMYDERDRELGFLRESNQSLQRAFDQIGQIVSGTSHGTDFVDGTNMSRDQNELLVRGPSQQETRGIGLQSPFNLHGHMHAHAITPWHCNATCPLDQIFLDVLESSKMMMSRGVPIDTVVGPRKPCVKVVVDGTPVSGAVPMSGPISEIVSVYPGFALPERLAFFYIMCLSTRWKISPTRENYLAMPFWLRPTVIQVTTSHPIWMDNIPWPGMRDFIIESFEDFHHPEFSPHFSTNISVNWMDGEPYVGSGDQLVLTETFEKHVRDLRNWTMSSAFTDRFPALAETFK